MDYMLFKKDPLDEGRPIVIDRKRLVKIKKKYTTNHFVMVMVIRGEGIYIDHTTGKEYPVKTGCIMQRFIGRTHTVLLNDEDNEQYYLRIPMEAYMACKLVQNLDYSPPVFEMDMDEYVELLDHFVDENANKSYEETLPSIISLVLHLHKGHRSYIPNDDGSEVIRRAARILTNDLKADIDLEWLADLSQMSYRTFRRRFVEVFECSPGAYRLKYKMEAAEHYLKHSQLSVNEISNQLGYSSSFSFSRQFKRDFHLSPAHFRQKYKEEV